MLELYHHGSSACAAKVRFALAEKQLEWTGHYLDLLRGEQFLPDFLAINPKAVVPVLIHEGETIRESTVICEYLEETFSARPIYPDAPRLRAKVRIWTKAVDEELHPACSAMTYIVSHRHTILRNGVGSFDVFLKQAGSEGLSARALKWQWVQHGLDAPGVADKIRLYDGYLHKMEEALAGLNVLSGWWRRSDSLNFPVFFPVTRELGAETGSNCTGASASQCRLYREFPDSQRIPAKLRSLMRAE